MDRFWAAVRRLPRYIFLGTNLVRDDRVPGMVKGTIVVGGLYVVSPVDLIPGIIPVAGQLDDLVVLVGDIQGHIEQVGIGLDVLRSCLEELDLLRLADVRNYEHHARC